MSQRYMLDTNVLSHIMQGRDAALLARLTQLPVEQVVISSVTLAELEYGPAPQRAASAIGKRLEARSLGGRRRRSENRPQRGQFLPDLQRHSRSYGAKRR